MRPLRRWGVVRRRRVATPGPPPRSGVIAFPLCLPISTWVTRFRNPAKIGDFSAKRTERRRGVVFGVGLKVAGDFRLIVFFFWGGEESGFFGGWNADVGCIARSEVVWHSRKNCAGVRRRERAPCKNGVVPTAASGRFNILRARNGGNVTSCIRRGSIRKYDSWDIKVKGAII